MNIIDLKLSTTEQNRVLESIFDDKGDSFACVDTSGNLIVFYLLKNRYVTICKGTNPSSFCFTEKNQGLLFLANPSKVITVHNLSTF